MNTIHFVVVMHPVDSVHEYGDKENPKIWVACIAESYDDAEEFQKTLLSTLNNSDICIIFGADLSTGEGVIDIKAVLEGEVN